MITTISFINYRKNKFWAFKQMAESHKYFVKNSNIIFYKLLGTGAGEGFSLVPDFSTYAVLAVWNDYENAKKFIERSDYSKLISEKAYSRNDFFLKTIQSQGLWNNKNPFNKNTVDLDKNKKIGIITRGKIRLIKQLDFWLNVPKASNAIKNAKGVEFYKGIGELPLMEQATFSVWKNFDAVKKFAYDSQAHSEIIKKTRKRSWYSEDLFARFMIEENNYQLLN